MSTFQENLLRARLVRAADNIAHRQQLAGFYAKALEGAGIEPPRLPPNSKAVMVRYPVRVKDKAQMLSAAQKQGLELGDWFVSPLHPLMNNWEKLSYSAGSCPVAEELCRTVVNLPTHPGVTQAEAVKISSLVIQKVKPSLEPREVLT
jgi:dTDP-4-amino-4,6-dideoxygalactose transaminase